MDKIKFELKNTSDGSHTLTNNLFNTEYHSIHGAVQESLHVFIKCGLDYLLSQRPSSAINILEIGLGTHLNVLLTFEYLENHAPKTSVYYEAIEKYPIPIDILSTLNYSNYVTPKTTDLFSLIIHSHANYRQHLTPQIELKKAIVDLTDYHTETKFDLIYMDAFGPRTQPEMWSIEVFEKLYQFMKVESILVTYCASGQVRRNLERVGFIVQRLPGPPGKREMLRALLQKK